MLGLSAQRAFCPDPPQGDEMAANGLNRLASAANPPRTDIARGLQSAELERVLLNARTKLPLLRL